MNISLLSIYPKAFQSKGFTRLFLSLLLGAGCLAVPPARAQTDTVMVFAAASLANALQELVPKFRDEKVEMLLSLGSSSALAKQIQHGAPAEVFFSANLEWMSYLDSLGLVEKESCTELLGNSLVVVAPKGKGFEVEAQKGFDFAGALKGGRLALGDPAHVPAGIYAKQSLQWLGWWDGVQDKLAPAADVRAALAYVEQGECAAGIVYATDVGASAGVEVVAILPVESHQPVVYPVAAVKGKCSAAAHRLLALLQAPAAGVVFEKCGFVRLEPAPPKPQ
ncbi:MAG: molybdate ABC transporter substrate-binding protein [Candidatus Handelsmanbacteria bacterium]|nr:molybdate ABC transporter substrate-binding protein [Candidatus Handelsmanbacteria bacterium]